MYKHAYRFRPAQIAAICILAALLLCILFINLKPKTQAETFVEKTWTLDAEQIEDISISCAEFGCDGQVYFLTPEEIEMLLPLIEQLQLEKYWKYEVWDHLSAPFHAICGDSHPSPAFKFHFSDASEAVFIFNNHDHIASYVEGKDAALFKRRISAGEDNTDRAIVSAGTDLRSFYDALLLKYYDFSYEAYITQRQASPTSINTKSPRRSVGGLALAKGVYGYTINNKLLFTLNVF